MSEEFYLKTKYSRNYLSWTVPWSKKASRRRKFTYKDLENMSDELIAIIDVVEIDDKYEKDMDEKEREWFEKQEKTPVAEELSLFEEYSDVDDSDLDKALSNLEGADK